MKRAGYLGFVLGLALTVGASAAEKRAVARPGKAASKLIWLVVTRPMFVKSLQPLIEHRKADGYETILSTRPVETAIRNCPRPPAMILLVGDDEPGKQNEPWYLPAKRIPQYRWASYQEKLLPSDAVYGDLDGDLVPDIPVGRLPVRTAEQAKAFVGKILTYEAQPPRLEDLDLLLWAGSADFGPVFDRLATPLLLASLQHHAPHWAQPFLLSANSENPWRGWLPDQPVIFYGRLQRQPGLICLIGHGKPNMFFVGTLLSEPREKALLVCTAESIVTGREKAEPLSPTIILACLCGQFAGTDLSLAEGLVQSPGGPVACVAASAESHPLPNFYTGQAMLKAAQRSKRLGEFWLQSVREAKKLRNPKAEDLLTNIEGSMGHRVNIEKFLADQELLYQVFGDPATKLRLPGRLHGSIQKDGDGVWHWTVRKPRDADRLIVTFRPDGRAMPAAPKNPRDIEASRKAFRQANETFAFERLGELPADRPWEGTIRQSGVLRLVAVGPKQLYVAALRLRRPKS